MNCLITGASVGIGASLAKELAKNKVNLYLTYYSRYEDISKLKKSLEEKYKIKCFIQKLDLKNEQEIKDVIFNFKNKLGNMDLLINNAATYNDNDLFSKTKSEFMNVLEVNVVGTFLISQEALKIMNKKSLIINMASTDGIDTYNLYNLDYAVSKASLIQLTKSMALICKDIKILAIAPNWVLTESTKNVDKDFLTSELKRINQKELITEKTVVDIIMKTINNKSIKSGEVIRIDENL